MNSNTQVDMSSASLQAMQAEELAVVFAYHLFIFHLFLWSCIQNYYLTKAMFDNEYDI